MQPAAEGQVRVSASWVGSSVNRLIPETDGVMRTHSQRAATATASPPPTPTSGSPASWIGSHAKYLILRADGIMTRHRRSRMLLSCI